MGKGKRFLMYVALFTGITLLIQGCANTDSGAKNGIAHASSSARSSVLVNSEWKITIVRSGSTDVPLRPTWEATIKFGPQAIISGKDTLNTFYGHYATTETGFVTSDMSLGGQGYAGQDADRIFAIKAIDALTDAGPNGGSGANVTVQGECSGLVLHVSSFELVLSELKE